jgi:dynactin complex subunit
MNEHNYPIKIYWNTDNNINQTIEAADFFDYMKQRLETNYIQTNEELNNTYKFLNHNEYNLSNYFKFLFEYYQYKLQPNNLIFVDDELAADIKIVSVESQTIILENAKSKKTVKFGIEYDIPIPYLTGIYKYSENDALLSCNVNRKYLLSYIGGSWRGPYNKFGQPKRYVTI